MAVTYLKRAAKTPGSETDSARKVVADMLAEIAQRGEEGVRAYALKLDRWSGDIVMSREAIKRRTRDVPAAVRRDIEWAAHACVILPGRSGRASKISRWS